MAMLTATPTYSAMTPSENRIAPVLTNTRTMVEVQPSGVAAEVKRTTSR